MADVHGEVTELLGAYALHAVDPDERVLVDRHLLDCSDCQSELAGFERVTDLLGVTGIASGSSSWPVIAEHIAPAERPRGGPSRWLGVAAAVFLVVLSGFLLGQRQEIGTLSAQLAQTRAEASTQVDEQTLLSEAAVAALADGDGQLVSLGAENTARQVTIVLSDGGSGYIANHNLPALDDGRTYQLWAVVGDQVISVGVLGSDPGVVAFHVGADGLTAFAVTEEVPGGVVSSQNSAVVAWHSGET